MDLTQILWNTSNLTETWTHSRLFHEDSLWNSNLSFNSGGNYNFLSCVTFGSALLCIVHIIFFTGKRYLHCFVGTPGWVDMACPFSPFAGLYLNDLCVTWLINRVRSCPDEAGSILFYFDWARCSRFRGCTENCLPSILTLCAPSHSIYF